MDSQLKKLSLIELYSSLISFVIIQPFLYLIFIGFNFYVFQISTALEQKIVVSLLYFIFMLIFPFYFPRFITNLYVLFFSLISKQRLPKRNERFSWIYEVAPSHQTLFTQKLIIFAGASILSYISFSIASAIDLIIPIGALLLTLVILYIPTFRLTKKESLPPTNPNKNLPKKLDKNQIETVVQESKNEIKQYVATENSKISINYFRAPTPYAKFIPMKTIQISSATLFADKTIRKRMIFHELGHYKQGIILYFPLLTIIVPLFTLPFLPFSMIIPHSSSSFAFSYLQMFNVVFFILLTYTIGYLLPFFLTRKLNWMLEINAEKYSARILSKEEYNMAIDRGFKASIQRSRIIGTGIERFFMFYPPPEIQYLNAIRQF